MEDFMKTIEAAVIFPITLTIMVLLILLSFNLHDMILYKAAAYKFLTCNVPNSIDYNNADSQDLSILEDYIYKHSLTNNLVDLENNEYSINIDSCEYEGSVKCEFYNKCDLLRKFSAAGDVIE